MDFSERLRSLRQEFSMTQDDLAKKIDVRRPAISGYETKNQQPDFKRLCLIAEVFNVTTDFLLGISDIRNFDVKTLEIQSHSEDENKLLKIYYSLNNICKQNLISQAELLLNMQEDITIEQNNTITPQKGA